MSGDQPKKNGVDVLPDLMEVNPVAKRAPLKPVAVPPTDAQPVAMRKVVESQLQQLQRLNAMDHDLVELGSGTVTSFIRIDKRLDLLDLKVDERFDELEKILGLAKRAKQESGVALEEIHGVKERVDDLQDDIDEIKTAPGFDRATGKPVTREELEARELRAKLEASETAKKKLEDEATDARRARRNLLYSIIGGIIVAAAVGAYSYVSGHAAGLAEHPAAPVSPH